MFCTRLLAILSIVLAAGNAYGGFDFEIKTFKGAVAQSSFVVGDTVTVRVNLVDDGTPPPNFTTDTLQSFTATLAANSTEPNSGLPATFNSQFNASTNTFGADFTAAGGVGFTGSATGAGFLPTSSTPLFEFSYTPIALGNTTFSFVPGLGTNSASFVEPGSFPVEFPAGGLASSSISVSAVPEPTAGSLLLLGAVGMGFRRRRR